MPVYNCAEYVSEAIQSILDQTFADFELIIIDDQSTDRTRDIACLFHDPRIHLITKPENTGYTNSLNTGLQRALGKYIARMDGDDISTLDRFQKQFDFLEVNQEIALCGSWYTIIDSNQLIKLPITDGDIKLSLLASCPIAHPTVMMRNEFLKTQNILYNPDAEPAEDYDLWVRMARAGKFANLAESLLFYRNHSNQTSNIFKVRQIDQSNIIRKKMLLSFYPSASQNEQQIFLTLVTDGQLNTKKQLKESILLSDKVMRINLEVKMLPQVKFSNLIYKKVKNNLRHFYLHRCNYTPGTLLHFFSLHKPYRNFFSTFEYLKFIIKCSIFWKIKGANPAVCD